MRRESVIDFLRNEFTSSNWVMIDWCFNINPEYSTHSRAGVIEELWYTAIDC